MFETPDPPVRAAATARIHTTVAQRWVVTIRWAAAIVFVVFGAGKFINHASELASFRHYGLPAPSAFAYAIGVIEIAGGLLLARGRFVRPAALVLTGDMVGAIIVSGIGQGEALSLTLAPALLLAMIFLWRASAADPRLGRQFIARLPTRPGRDVI